MKRKELFYCFTCDKELLEFKSYDYSNKVIYVCLDCEIYYEKETEDKPNGFKNIIKTFVDTTMWLIKTIVDTLRGALSE